MTITLTNETYDDPVEAGNFSLGGIQGTNYPAGLSIESVSRSSATVAVVDLAFVGDFDTDFTDFYITIAAADLAQTSSGVLEPDNRLTITPFVEAPQATLTATSALSEYSLNGSILTISLDQENFIDPGALVAGNFTPMNEPPGLIVSSISGTPTPTSVDLFMGFNLTDFDVTYPDFYIMIGNNVLFQSSVDLPTTSLNIDYALEPVITNVSIPNDTMGIGSVVLVTITVENDEGNTFSLVDGALNRRIPIARPP